MNSLLCKTDCVGRGHADKVLLAIRLVAGIVFLVHGYGKLTGNPSIEMFSRMVGNLGLPMPMFFAWVVALTEALGGLVLILGIFVRPAAVLLSIVMLVAFGMVKKFGFPQGELDFVLLGIAVSLALYGPGRYSLAHKLMGKDAKAMDECCGGHDHKH